MDHPTTHRDEPHQMPTWIGPMTPTTSPLVLAILENAGVSGFVRCWPTLQPVLRATYQREPPARPPELMQAEAEGLAEVTG